MPKISKIHAMQVFDSRGDPTIETEVCLDDGNKASAIVPSGASKGRHEVFELRDTEDKKYPDCRPSFTKRIESAFNQGEIDGIKKKLRKKIQIWSPYIAKISKKQLISSGHKILGDKIFETWSCYLNKRFQCGNCESCNNRKNAFKKAKINDKTKYLK